MPTRFLPHLQGVSPFTSTDDALSSVLACLREFVPYSLWMVARRNDDDWTVLKSLDEGYGALPGKQFNWNDTYCSVMAKGEAPMFAEKAADIPAYVQAPINSQLQLPVGAYIGLPIYKEEGELVATLCALDPEAQAPLEPAQRRLVTTMARVLSTLLIAHEQAEEAKRKAERHRYEAETDLLTGLLNRRGWELAVSDQEQATQRTLQNAMVVVLDLDDLKQVNDREGHEAGDRLLKQMAQILRDQLRENDVVARLGGDEFAVLVPGTSTKEARQLSGRLAQALTQAGLHASMGWSLRLAHSSMTETLAAADARMYEDKAQRKSAASAGPAS